MKQPPTKNILISGVHKAGTTSLFSYLANHPKICPSEIKETHFFSDDSYNKRYKKYSEYFTQSSNVKYLMEASPEYIYGGKGTISKIQAQLENPKIIFIFRDPIDKIESSFRHRKSKLEFTNDYSFNAFVKDYLLIDSLEEINYGNPHQKELSDGDYIKYLPTWFQNFKEENIKVIFFDNLRDNPKETIYEICSWLSIESEVFDNFNFTIENKSVETKSKFLQKLAIKTNQKFEPFFRKNQLIKRKLRSLYYKFNAKKNNQEINREKLGEEKLKKLYFESNRQLKCFLLKKGYNDFPSWLNDEQ